ncbi:hypothetical protein [Leucobacter denitrificans]|uniref:NnrS family protein n=1 Tax=Leucobacter denitrificans TaxID=683042 RepID=A0A7G9S7E9_9MICO|nr:hypothetical protein [Leucobacter denitrificans]QNN63774.1 hypothetical protein H9L06_05720 [Leucobacter denitrificans]
MSRSTERAAQAPGTSSTPAAPAPSSPGPTRDSGAPKRKLPSKRLLWMLPAGLALLGGLDAGLLLMGLPAPITTRRLPEVHGALLILGFVATLVSLERATALGRWYGFIAPAILGLGAILLVTDPVPLVAAKCVVAAGLAAFTALYIPLWRRQYDASTLTQLLGTGLALAGAILWIGDAPFSRIVPWLIGFLVLTIAAERVELGRITMGPNAGSRLLLHAWALTAALMIGIVFEDAGAIALGVVLLSLVAWLAKHDIARRTIRTTGVTRYMAACILAGYVWLAVAGALLLFGFPNEQPFYDSIAHAVFLGYTFSMIMAHATTILPAVLAINLPYRGLFWVPAMLLQVALIVRLGIGNAFGVREAWHLGGYLGVAALLLFVLTAVGSAVVGKPRKGNRA